MPENLSMIRHKEVISQRNVAKHSFFNNSFSNFEETIKNDTKKFNDMMENQYKDFDFSYYYVESSTKALVEFILVLTPDKKISTPSRFANESGAEKVYFQPFHGVCRLPARQ
jgi:hypothetical protein